MITKLKKTLWFLSLVGFGLLAVPASIHAQPAPPQPKQLADADLVATLKKGGNVIYVRHGETDVSFSDQNREDLSEWSKQRNLTLKGRQMSATMGLAFRALGIPVSEVTVSPYCRAIETGKLAFGKVKISKDLSFAIVTDKVEAERLGKALKVMLGTKPAEGTNAILVAHTANLQEAANLWPKPEGVAFIFKPLGNGTFDALHRMEPQQWQPLAQKMGASIDPAKLQNLAERGQLCGKDSPTS